MRRQVLTLLAALALATALAVGIAHLFSLRFEKGDVYPAYSTLRADPVGAKVFHDALDALPDVATQRNYRPLPRLRPREPVTLFYAGVSLESIWGEGELRVFEELISKGSRAVFTFSPTASRPAPKATPEAKKVEPGKDAKMPDPLPQKEEEARKKAEAEAKQALIDARRVAFAEVAKRWGFQFEVTRLSDKRKLFVRQAMVQGGQPLEAELSWHSGLFFTALKPEWKTIYTRDGEAVMIERPWGAGSIVLAADSFFVSNEALRTERHPRLLAWLAGTPRTIVFDEEHHGVAEASDFTTLIRKYRLQGAIAALALVAALFVWKNSVRFIPPQESSGAEGAGLVVSGRESSEGFVALLRRSIPPGQVVDACIAEWRKSFAHQPSEVAKLDRAIASPATAAKDPVSIYRRLSGAIGNRVRR